MVARKGQTGTTDAGTDPAYVPDREVFGAYTHQQIWDLVHERLAPGELSRLAGAWELAADAVDTAFDEFARDIARLSGEWSGIAAAEAARAAAALVRAGDDTATVCRVVGQLLAGDATAAESVRAAIPAPPPPYVPDPDPAVEAATGPVRRTSYNITAATLTAEAQDAMTYRYNPAIPASGDQVPRFPSPAETPTGQDSAPAPSGGPIPTDTSQLTADTSPADAPDEPRPAPPDRPSPSGGTVPASPGAGPPAPQSPTLPASASPEPAPRPGQEQSGPKVAPAGPAPGTTEAAQSGPGGTSSGSTSSGEPVPAEGTTESTGPTGDTPGPPPAGRTADPAPATGLPGSGDPEYTRSPQDTNTESAGSRSTESGWVRPDSAPGTHSATPTFNGAAAGPGGERITTEGPRALPGTPPSAPAGIPAAPSGGPGTTAPAGPAAAPSGTTLPGTATPDSRSTATTTGAGTPRQGLPHTADPVPHPGLADAASGGTTGPKPADSNTEPGGTDHAADPPGPRSPRLPPAAVPAPPATGPSAPSGRRLRPSPDYPHAPNEDLTETPPRMPPVLGEQTGADRPDDADPGGGSR